MTGGHADLLLHLPGGVVTRASVPSQAHIVAVLLHINRLIVLQTLPKAIKVKEELILFPSINSH